MKRLIPFILLPLLAACGNSSDSAKSIADYKNATPSDSLMFYYGQLRSADYWREAKADSTLMTQDSRNDYMRGVRDGIKAVKDNNAYNLGLFLGIQFAMQSSELNNDYDTKVNSDIFCDALADGLRNDSVVDAAEAAGNFQQVLAGMNAEKEKRELEKSKTALAASAKNLKMTKINDTLYGAEPTTPGNGPILKLGDNVAVVLNVSVIGGKSIDDQASPDLKIGSKLIGPVTEALLTMRMGETRVFITTPPALLGRMYERRGLNPDDILRMTITVSQPAPKPEVVK